MKGYKWLEKEDLNGLVTKEHEQKIRYRSEVRNARLVDFLADVAVWEDEPVLLRYLLDRSKLLPTKKNAYWARDGCVRIIIDAGYEMLVDKPRHNQFIVSRHSARLAAILTMRAIRRMGSIYRDPARMVGRAIWASRAYYLEESERALKK